MRALLRPAVLLVVVLIATLAAPMAAVADDVDSSEIFFPVQVTDQMHYGDHWGHARSGGRRHLGVDIMSPAMTPVFAAQSGTIFATKGEEYLLLDGDDGRMYFYVHLNNDTPGRPNGCDGAGGPENAFAPRLVEALRQNGTMKGLRVERGEHLGYLGSSGNASCSGPHLHFEIWNGEGWSGHGEGSGSINPYPPTKAAQDAGNVWGPNWTPGDPAPSSRVAGATRIDTAIQLSRKAFPNGAQTVVVAPATAYQEALVAAPLASTVGGPVLLAWPDSTSQRAGVSDALAAEVDRLGAEYAIVVGAARRLGNEVVDELVAKTDLAADDIRRMGEADPGALSAHVAEVVLTAQGISVPADDSTRGTAQASDPTLGLPPLQQQASARQTAAAQGDAPDPVDPLLAAGTHPRGLGWPDALAASVLGSRQLAPVLLTPSGELHPDVARVLSADGIRTARVVGGELAIQTRVEDQIHDQTGRATARLAGGTRYETSQAVQAEISRDGARLSTLSVATGLNFPDALAAGPALALLNRSFVLVDGARVNPSVQSWISRFADQIDELEVVGGPDAISDFVLRQAAMAANEDQ